MIELTSGDYLLRNGDVHCYSFNI